MIADSKFEEYSHQVDDFIYHFCMENQIPMLIASSLFMARLIRISMETGELETMVNLLDAIKEEAKTMLIDKNEVVH